MHPRSADYRFTVKSPLHTQKNYLTSNKQQSTATWIKSWIIYRWIPFILNLSTKSTKDITCSEESLSTCLPINTMSSNIARFLTLDLTIPSTISRTSANPALLFDESQQYKLCSKHEHEKQAKSNENCKGPIGLVCKNWKKVQSLFFTSPLQKKLNYYGIKIKVDFATKRKVTPLDTEKYVFHSHRHLL